MANSLAIKLNYTVNIYTVLIYVSPLSNWNSVCLNSIEFYCTFFRILIFAVFSTLNVISSAQGHRDQFRDAKFMTVSTDQPNL